MILTASFEDKLSARIFLIIIFSLLGIIILASIYLKHVSLFIYSFIYYNEIKIYKALKSVLINEKVDFAKTFG